LDFSTIDVGESRVLSVVITNDSAEDMQLKGAVTEHDAFTISGVVGGEIIPSGGGSFTYQITFAPTEAGYVESQLSMSVGPVQDWGNIPAEEVDWGTAYGVVLRGIANVDFSEVEKDTFTADNTYRVSASASTSEKGKLYVLLSHDPLSQGKIYALTSDGSLKNFIWETPGWQSLEYLDSAAPGLAVDLSQVDFRGLGCSQCLGQKPDSGDQDFHFGNIIITPPDDTPFNNATDFKYMPGTLYIGTYVKDASCTGAFDFNKGLLELQTLHLNSFAGTWQVTSNYYGADRVRPSHLVVTETGNGEISAVWPGYNASIAYAKPNTSGYIINFSMGIYNYTYKITSLTVDKFSGTYSCIANGEVVVKDAAVSGVRLK